MKFAIAASVLLASSASGFQPLAVKPQSLSSLQLSSADDGESSRRSFMKSAVALVAGVSAQASTPDSALASLLDDYGSDPSKIKDSAAEARAIAAKNAPKSESDYEPNLRSNYYYPTNKKRYLPRIKKCNDAIPDAAAMIGTGDWEGAEIFAVKIADDTILPMKLYTSSLLGGGTNVKISFGKEMTDAAKNFEKAQKALVKGIAKKDQEKSTKALEDLSTALLSYRTAGKLLGADGGGDIPSIDEIRRSACRVQGRRFEQTIKQRDARLAGAL